ncbi:3-isopropylmalate dehydratase large subunit [Halosegnis rubeus]|jgi:3-isopropylmalate/(R)-2-methylmalate dehydratase large subunit|uniref:3-isopropylmalate dehydratase large subunit n=1 Tax=Halosegnis rubeus TaxID=2212850 RepID=A0A5N5U8X5_9EURY|nr:3-isopropylmalate dehydratase large subunit [Halosegnis rubeus]KAB7512449.1 3-isopropylmalate dehydratase large subunit [Halosegnis rubeus]KAB7512709.1 3-isopropylmalate dehydratase large subunit [Halosegnis rubeus]KAB7514122.1 3-isopropylmalate dehydratase large subunit [Halosegnis rubeus]
MSSGTLYDKVWDRHKVADLPDGRDQLFIGLHLMHEVTSPQAFGMLRERDIDVAFPERTLATTDHIIPTDPAERDRPFEDEQAETMLQALESNVEEAGIDFYGLESGKQGIAHVVGPELGATQPGQTIVCGDSHTSTHGAFGAVAMGIGTSQIRDVLATGCIAAEKMDVRRVEVTGELSDGVAPKDVILHIIGQLGVDGGVGHVYEYGGEAIEAMDMEGRLSVCNMSIEGGARAGYVNPDQTTYDYLEGRQYAPEGDEWNRLVADWETISSDPDAEYDDVVTVDADGLDPMVTWGINPGQVTGITEPIPSPDDFDGKDRKNAEDAVEHMEITPGETMEGYEVDVAFLGTCTNGRVSDFRRAAEILEGNTVDEGVRALAVPGSETVRTRCEEEGIDQIFKDAGFQWRQAGCSMCLAMNGDSLEGDEVCASSSNRNFIGRQGSKEGRTVLMSPAMVAAAAVEGEIADVRSFGGAN